DGNATVNVIGGTSPYTYLWSPSGGTNATAKGLSAGAYSCLITDAAWQTLTKNLTISQPTSLHAVGMATNVTCNGGSNGTATVTASGGSFPYSYSWSPSGGTGATATGLAAGAYTCTITDANNCSVQKQVIVTQ